MEITQLKPFLQEALQRMHITTLSEVQQTIPFALQQKDLFVLSPTGSGKTLSYVLPVLNSLQVQKSRKHFPHALILVPTRELALQIAQVIREVLFSTEGIRTAVLTGGVDIQKQIRSFHTGADIVVGTPSRIRDHLRRHTLKTTQIQTVILDEADEMVTMGFEEDVLFILNLLKEHQTLLYSATSSAHLKELSSSIQKDPLFFTCTSSSVLPQKTHYKWYLVNEKTKFRTLLSQLSDTPAIIFCNTKHETDQLYHSMLKKNLSVNRIYSGLAPVERKKIMEDFRQGAFLFLCATDVLARGMDIPEVELVINYSYPESDIVFRHRIGRTSRANHQGTCITFLSESDRQHVKEIENIVHQKIHILR